VLTLLNVPFALTGGVFGLWLADMPHSLAAAVGDRRGIRDGMLLEHVVMEGAKDRLRPVLMTAALGLVPAAMSRAMGSETQRPPAWRGFSCLAQRTRRGRPRPGRASPRPCPTRR
jgi:cobalt-zinc-cadmium resistance protein CzcA